MTTDGQRNWAGNYRYSAARWHAPASVEALQTLVARGDKVKVIGTRHSFNGIADSTGDLVSLARLPRVLEIDRARQTVTVDGAMRYGDLAPTLEREGFALPNLASLPHISIAGACATATHGSGVEHGCLATSVTALEMVTASGELVALSRERDGEAFEGAVVGLGALGVVTQLTLKLTPPFVVQQEVYEGLPMREAEMRLPAILSAAYSVSLFTDWRDERRNQLWIKRGGRVAQFPPLPPTVYGATAATRDLHPIAELSAENCTPQMGIPGPWHERLPHFRLAFTPSSGDELQSEYLVPREHASAAFRALRALGERIAPLLMVSELRLVAADDLWMSPFYRRAGVAFHFTWRPDWPSVRALLPQIEAALAPFGARPHWGKLFTMAPARVQSLYERLPDFRRLALRYDPQGKFRNAFLDAYLFEGC